MVEGLGPGLSFQPHAHLSSHSKEPSRPQEDVGTHLGRILGVGGSVGAPRVGLEGETVVYTPIITPAASHSHYINAPFSLNSASLWRTC